LPLSISQSCRVPSSEPERMRFPSGVNAEQFMYEEPKRLSSFRVCKSHSCTAVSQPQESTNRSSCEKATHLVTPTSPSNRGSACPICKSHIRTLGSFISPPQ